MHPAGDTQSPAGSRSRLSLLVAAAALVVASCGGEVSSTTTTITSTAITSTTEVAGGAAAPMLDIQGHRGARGLKPEETLPSFETALDLRVTTLELDLHFTADDQVVIWHDAAIDDYEVWPGGRRSVGRARPRRSPGPPGRSDDPQPDR